MACFGLLLLVGIVERPIIGLRLQNAMIGHRWLHLILRSGSMPVLKLDGGLDLNYEMIDGEAGKPCLVFLHEGLGSIALWKGFPQRLCQATGCAGLVYEREGYGASSALRRARSIHYLHDYALSELPQV